MSKLIFATNNSHKVAEIQAAIGDKVRVVTLAEAGIEVDIPEPFDTLLENADEKARVIVEMTGENCFSEDTGLEVDFLNGEPGVKSARYAGEERSFDKNISKLLQKLGDSMHRTARFRTVITLVWNEQWYHFEGVCEGVITLAPRGDGGFGYDPVFQPDGSEKVFAEMSMDEKNLFSHRRKAADKLILFLQQQANVVTR